MEREPGPAYASGVVGETLRRRPAWRRLPNWLQRFAAVGALPSDSEEARLRKSVLVLSSSLMATLAFLWVGTYAALAAARSCPGGKGGYLVLEHQHVEAVEEHLVPVCHKCRALLCSERRSAEGDAAR